MEKAAEMTSLKMEQCNNAEHCLVSRTNLYSNHSAQEGQNCIYHDEKVVCCGFQTQPGSWI